MPRPGRSPVKRRTVRKPTASPAPAPGAVRGDLLTTQAPQLATLVEAPPEGGDWLSEVKFDGYRLLAFVADGAARLMTRNGHDWTNRLPTVAAALQRLIPGTALLDGELVALASDGVSNFAALQDALARGTDRTLFFYLFDLLHLDGWDLRPCRLADRKAVLQRLGAIGLLRYSDHLAGESGPMRRRACELGLEGIICKRADAPYRGGRGSAWLKLKCKDREEFVVLGWTPPARGRTGLGALQVGFHDAQGRLHFAGGVGTGFSERELTALRRRLEVLRAEAPAGLLYAGDPPERDIIWVRPELVAEVQYHGWSGAGRLRHASYLGLREDKAAAEVTRAVPDAPAERHTLAAPAHSRIVRAAPRRTAQMTDEQPRIAHAPARHGGREDIGGVSLSHPERELWPGITKHDLAGYWLAVAEHALPEIAGRPLAVVRCPEGIAGEQFFQKHGRDGFPPQIRAGEAGGAPYLAIDDAAGLVAAAQVGAIELHAWGATEADPLHPDRLVFDLDPGDGVAFAEVVATAKDVRDRLAALGLAGFCRTTGGKGLHVLAPLRPQADWPSARAWCQAFARAMEADSPARFVASLPKERRHGRILVDWLRNGLGSTAVASFSPRARPGAGVATRLAWREVTATLDPAAWTLANVPARLQRQRRDPWAGFAEAARPLPSQAQR